MTHQARARRLVTTTNCLATLRPYNRYRASGLCPPAPGADRNLCFPRPMDHRTAEELVLSSGLANARELVAELRPSFRVWTQTCVQAAIPLGESRFGGLPDVPQGFQWPRWDV